MGLTPMTQRGTPDAPTLTADPSMGDLDQIELTLEEPGNTGDSPILRYEIQIRLDDDEDADDADDADDPESDWAGATLMSPTPPTNLISFHSNVEGGETYLYRARAVNSVGASDYSAPPARGLAPDRAPGEITLTAIAVGATEILLQWNHAGRQRLRLHRLPDPALGPHRR